MILAALLAAAVAPAGPVEAERGFAAAAQTQGQWTAFRAHAADEAVMFVPRQVNAQAWLKDRRDPPRAVMWWPSQAWLSCDGTTAVTTGPWLREGGRLAGYFTTVWRRQPDGGWKWLLDHGGALERPRPAGDVPALRRGSCRGLPAKRRIEGVRGYETAASPDGSLVWNWHVFENGARMVWIELWDGAKFVKIVEDKVDE
ncbi:MAG TPA: hypothetical protein VHM92_13435 [Allosphingosinicella sp.]|nr:hypothetical protein [Allosphingosinicella sp.]